MKIVSAILGIALVVVSGAAIYLWREVEAGRQQIAQLQGQLDDGQTIAAAITNAPLAASAIASAGVQAATRTAGPETPAEATRPAPIPVPDIDTLRAQLSSPEAIARRRITTRMLMETSNPDVREALGLSAEEAEKLLDLLAAHQERTSSVFNDSAGGTAQERSAAFSERQQANQAELQAMLGSKYSQWQDYVQTRSAWQQRRDLRAVLDAAGTPMTDAQSRSLIAALSAEQRKISQQTLEAANQGRSFSVGMSRYTPERRQGLLDAASGHLSTQQLESYRAMLERAAAQEQTMLAPIRAAAEAAERAAAAGNRAPGASAGGQSGGAGE